MEKEQANPIFKNPVLEAMTWTSFPLHVVWYSGVSIGLFIVGSYINDNSIGTLFMLFVAGLVSWSLIEYFMHRFVFHFISENKFIKKFHYIFHGIHHEFPTDEKRTMMPPLPGLIIISIYVGMSYLFLNNLAFPFVGGITLGYLFYSGLHYSIHHFKPPGFLKKLWVHHLVHHYQEPDKAFGVSSVFWDRIFKTMPNKKA